MRREKKNPIYTLEVFLKSVQDTEQISDRIIRETGMTPAFYDNGTHLVVAHKIDFNMLKMTLLYITDPETNTALVIEDR
jgi:hypothetical protein